MYFLALAMLPWAAARAEIEPLPGSGDPRIQYAVYDPEEVVVLRVAPGFAMTVRLSNDERIETVAVGDSAAWQVQAYNRGDLFVVKPNGFAPQSNLVVTTDQRTYSFTLALSTADPSRQAFVVNFTYPPAKAAASEPTLPTGTYRLKGNKAVWPSSISDDGRETSLIWPAETTLPAVYARNDKGAQILINGVMRDGALVIEGIYAQVEFVRGKLRARAERKESAK